MKNDLDIKCYAPEGTLKVVLNILEGFPPGRVLDIPSGQGALAEKSKREGDFVCADIDEKNYSLEKTPFIKLDMNDPLPFKNDTFDHVVCLEGIEHIENPFMLLREISRILRPEGNLIISTPNILTLKSRTRFLFYSYHDHFRYLKLGEDFRHNVQDYDHEHINPMTFGEIRLALEKAGMSIVGISTNRYLKSKKWGIFYPLIKRLIISLTRKKSPNDPDLVSREILEGEILIISAKKCE
jgi:SAM-dependent methyltransferase